MQVIEVESGDPSLRLYRVDNGTIALTFLPAVGGRLLSIQINGHELLWVNPQYFDSSLRVLRPRSDWQLVDGTFATWSNIGGSKSWPAPQGWGGQGEWAGPPDAVLDSGEWSFAATQTSEAIRVSMTSPPDPATGLQVNREFTIPAAGPEFAEVLRFTNVTDHPITWSMWEVCQVAAEPEGVIEIPSVANQWVDLGSYIGAASTYWADGLMTLPIQDAVAKLGFPSATGAISYRDRHGGLEMRFRPGTGRYPDQGSRAEVWIQFPVESAIDSLSGLHPDARLAELEVLSPLVRFEPGRSADFDIAWTALSAQSADARTALRP